MTLCYSAEQHADLLLLSYVCILFAFFSDVLIAMQDVEAGIPLKPYHTQHKDFSNCFSGEGILFLSTYLQI